MPITPVISAPEREYFKAVLNQESKNLDVDWKAKAATNRGPIHKMIESPASIIIRLNVANAP